MELGRDGEVRAVLGLALHPSLGSLTLERHKKGQLKIGSGVKPVVRHCTTYAESIQLCLLASQLEVRIDILKYFTFLRMAELLM